MRCHAAGPRPFPRLPVTEMQWTGYGKQKFSLDPKHDRPRTDPQMAEERGAKPACVRGTGAPDDVGMIRLDFPGYSGEDKLQPISWDEWFEKFDERKLALVYQDETSGGQKSNFNKLVSRENAA